MTDNASSAQDPDRFVQSDTDAVVGHMNRDHTGDALLIARAFGGVPESATEARTADLDKLGVVIEAVVDGEPVQVRVPWNERIEERPGLRPAIAQMYRDACAELGIEPRPAAPH